MEYANYIVVKRTIKNKILAAARGRVSRYFRQRVISSISLFVQFHYFSRALCQKVTDT